MANLQDDLIKEQEAVDCLKQIIVVVDDATEDQAFTDLESKLTNLSDRWSNVCKFVSARWHVIQDLINKLDNIETDFNEISIWTNQKSVQLKELINKIDQIQVSIPENSKTNESLSTTSMAILDLIKTLKDIEFDMQKMHAKLNEMNELGELISSQLNNSPQLTQSLNNKMDTLENKWNGLLNDMEYLSKKCNEQHILLQQQQKSEIQVNVVEQQQYNHYINELYKVLNKTSELINLNLIYNEDSITSVEEQHEIIKVEYFLK